MAQRLNPEEQRQQKLESQKKQIQEFVSVSAAFQRVFDGEDGEIVYSYLKKQTAGFNVDPYQHAFNAGKSRIVKIIDEMKDDKEYKKHIEYLKELENGGTSDDI